MGTRHSCATLCCQHSAQPVCHSLSQCLAGAEVSLSLSASVSPGMGKLSTDSPQLTWQTRQTVMVLDVVQEPMEGEQGRVGRAGF